MREVETAPKRQPRRVANPILATQFAQDEADVIGPPSQPVRVRLLGRWQSLDRADRRWWPAFGRKYDVTAIGKDRQHRLIRVRHRSHAVAVPREVPAPRPIPLSR